MTPRAHDAARRRSVIGVAALTAAVSLSPFTSFSAAGASATEIGRGATATETAVRTDPPSPPPADPAPSSPAAVVVHLANQQRAAAGRAPLTIDASLTGAAMQHSDDQAARDRMSHVGSDGSNVGQRIVRNGGSFRTWGENVAAGFSTAAAVVDAWMNSPGHRRNILNGSFTRIGVGTAVAADGTRYWTMVLAG